MKVLVYVSVCGFVLGLLCVLVFLLSYSYDKTYNAKGASFECGFQSFAPTNIPFSMPFFLVSLMFLLFDVEIILVCFFPFSYFMGSSVLVFWSLLFLILGATLYEWLVGVLSWS